MQNYSQYFANALADFESPLCPAGTEDAAKGQVTVRAGYYIHLVNFNIGYIAKNTGQTQFAGVGVDVLKDKSDGSWDDYLTDIDAGNGMREVRIAYSPHPADGSGASLWVEPDESYLTVPGPLVLKSETPDPPDPEPEPEPVPPDSDQLARIEAKLDALTVQTTDGFQQVTVQMTDGFQQVLAQMNANTEKVQQQLHQIVEDAEDTLKKVAPFLIRLLRNADDDQSGGLPGGR